jgi:hypothetical protein
MSSDRGFEDIYSRLDAIIPAVLHKAVEGANRGADVLQSDAQATSAYNGMSGATRASTVAYVASTEDDGSSKVNTALRAAEALLDGFTGHSGATLLEDSGETVEADHVKVVLTVPTDYIKWLEIGHGGRNAFLGDTMDNGAPKVFDKIASALKELF